MLVLGVETSCDETSAAVVEDARQVLSNIVHSQIPIHARYGGVVPELASRNHVMAIQTVVDMALGHAQVSLSDLDGVAVTMGPGLVGSLMVGLEFAKAVAYASDVPLVGVHHLEGHLLSPFVDDALKDRVGFPYVALAVSGGHTSLYWVTSAGAYQLLGRTLDDAAGECLDKVAKRLGAPYPGGPWVERTGGDGHRDAYELPRPLLGRGLDFSFSGLKTAAALLIQSLEADTSRAWVADLCASVQWAVVEVLVDKCFQAVRAQGAARLVVAGGVACNGVLREALRQRGEAEGVVVCVPNPTLCTDNGAMIACAGAMRLMAAPRQGFSEFSLDASASVAL